MTPEEAAKIVAYLEHRSAPKPKPEQKASLTKDLIQFDFQKTVDRAKQYAIESNWFPVISQISPPLDAKPYKHNFKPGTKGKAGIERIKKVIEKEKAK